ncbi:MAG: Endonuclease III [Ktedonobacterales bacterium]|jgi:endonuclease-3|nr:MAG: Endonuclease III [Ktedonobacterales bacterium]
MPEPSTPSAAEQQRARAIMAELRTLYPDAKCSLDFTTPLELLVATILSAQCTDERVNQVTAKLFKKYRTAADYANAAPEELEQDVKQTGFYRNKAKNIRAAGMILVERFNGEVPREMAQLIQLPGVARKTANVVMGNAYGIVEGVVVDTHVGRIARRLGLTESEDPVKVEQDLMALLPQSDWLDLSHMLIYHGRAICQARKPLCEQCSLVPLCPTGQANTSASATTQAAPATAPARSKRAKA